MDEFKRTTRSFKPHNWKCKHCGPSDGNKQDSRQAARHRLKLSDDKEFKMLGKKAGDDLFDGADLFEDHHEKCICYDCTQNWFDDNVFGPIEEEQDLTDAEYDLLREEQDWLEGERFNSK